MDSPTFSVKPSVENTNFQKLPDFTNTSYFVGYFPDNHFKENAFKDIGSKFTSYTFSLIPGLDFQQLFSLVPTIAWSGVLIPPQISLLAVTVKSKSAS